MTTLTAFSAPPTFVPLQVLTAAELNAIGGSINSLKWWTQAGSIPVSTDASTIEELVYPSVASVLWNDNTGTVKWNPASFIAPTFGTVTVTGATATGSSWADFSGFSVTLTLPVTCSVMMFVYGRWITGNISYPSLLRGVIDGTADTNTAEYQPPSTQSWPLVYAYCKQHIASGSRIIHAQGIPGVSNDIINLQYAVMVVIAFPEGA